MTRPCKLTGMPPPRNPYFPPKGSWELDPSLADPFLPPDAAENTGKRRRKKEPERQLGDPVEPPYPVADPIDLLGKLPPDGFKREDVLRVLCCGVDSADLSISHVH